MTKHILFVLTSQDVLPSVDVKTGVWLEELAASYWPLVDAGHQVILASPKGGEAPLDPMSLAKPWLTASGQRFLENTSAMEANRKTLTLDEASDMQFDAVYLIGGAGTVYDFPSNPAIASLLAVMSAANKPIAAVCHGVSGLLNGASGDRENLVTGRRLTAISNAEDAIGGLDKILPMMPETPLRAAGALYSAAAPFEPHVVEDGNLITGQNPASAAGVTQALLARLSGGA
ncbi:type 1 glutamine amidotransferase domain-containing protein [Paraburkholderia megapolitana]|uniref:type 1 glutamine amidotransferase domain-containing protein n=1 Tax=Paraburkholderia megapolitana TaxID=420953 RepID=UPI0038B8AD6F